MTALDKAIAITVIVLTAAMVVLMLDGARKEAAGEVGSE
jgi:hypothetical protein